MNTTATATNTNPIRYKGFWSRVWASLIDTFIVLLITYPVLFSIYGWEYIEGNSAVAGYWDFILGWVLPMIGIIIFWIYRQATPGKMAISAIIVDAKTGNKPTLKQYIVRYIGYFIATIPLGLGFFWIAWDKRKQGWHDKLAGTVVISSKKSDSPQNQRNE